MTEIPFPPYSYGMISEFHELSDKIDQLAALTLSLRRENAQLRRANAMLTTDNEAYAQRLGEAHRRVEALLVAIPALEHDTPAEADADADEESAE